MLDSLGRRWDPALHPRDRKGRFIRTFRKVRLFDPGTSEPWGVGKVDSIVDADHIKVTVTALNQNVPSNHQIGEKVNAPANGLESVNDVASIRDAENAGANRAAVLPTKEELSDKGKQWGFSDAEIAEAHAVVDGNNDGNSAGKYLNALVAYNKSRTPMERDPRAQRNGRTGSEANRTRFIQVLDELGVDSAITDDTPDGLSGIKPLLDDYNASRTEQLPEGWTEELPIELDRQFKNSEVGTKGFATLPNLNNSENREPGPDEQPQGMFRPVGREGFEPAQNPDPTITSLLTGERTSEPQTVDPEVEQRSVDARDQIVRSGYERAGKPWLNGVYDISQDSEDLPNQTRRDLETASNVQTPNATRKNILTRLHTEATEKSDQPEFARLKERLDPIVSEQYQINTPTTEASAPTNNALNEDDVAAEIESTFLDGETTLAPDERADLLGGYYMERGNDGHSTIYDSNGDEVSSISDTASDEQIQRAAQDVSQHSEANAPAAEQTDAPQVEADAPAPAEQVDTPTTEAEPEPPLSDQDIQDTIDDWTDNRDPNTSREQVVTDRLDGTEVSDENRQALIEEARSRDELDSDPRDQRDPAALDRAAREEVDRQDREAQAPVEQPQTEVPTPEPVAEQTDAPSTSDIGSYTDAELQDFINEHLRTLLEGGMSRDDERQIEADLAEAQNERNNRESRADVTPAEQTAAPEPVDAEQAATEAVQRLDALPDNATPEETLQADTDAVSALADVYQASPERAQQIGETRAQQNRNNFREFTPRGGEATPASNLVEGENPADTSLLRHMRDDEGQYRWHERGADAKSKMRIGDDVFFIKSDRVYRGKIKDMKTHSQPAIYFEDQDGKGRWVHVDRVFKDHGLTVNTDGTGAVISAPEGLDQQGEIDHFIDSFGQVDNSGNFGMLKANGGVYKLSNGYTLETGQRRGLILKDPDGNVVDRSFRVQGGLDEHKNRFFDNRDQLVDQIDRAINNNEASKHENQTEAPTVDAPETQVDTPTVEPEIAQTRRPTSEAAVGPDDIDIPDLPRYTPEEIQAFDETPLTREGIPPIIGTLRGLSQTPDGYDLNRIQDGTILTLPVGYHGIRSNNGWDIYSPESLVGHVSDSEGSLPLVQGSRLWLAVHDDRISRSTGAEALHEADQPGGSAGYNFDALGTSDDIISGPQLAAAATEAVRFLDANPGVGSGVYLPLPGGYRVSKNADGSIKISHPDPEVLTREGRTLSRGEFTNLVNSPDLNAWLSSTRNARNLRRARGEDPNYPNYTAEEVEPQFNEFVDNIRQMTDPSQVFNADQPVALGNFVARRNRTNDGWNLEGRDGSTVTSMPDNILAMNPAVGAAIVSTLMGHHQPPTPDADPVNIVPSEPWVDGETLAVSNVIGEVSAIPRINGRLQNMPNTPILDGRYDLSYNPANATVRVTSPDGMTATQWHYGDDNQSVSQAVVNAVNELEHRRLANLPISPTPEEVWGRPDPDQAAQIGGRVRINETGQMGIVESLTATGNSAIVRLDSGDHTTRRLSSLTGFKPEDLDDFGINPAVPLGRTRKAVRAMRNIKNADRMDEWLIKANQGSLTDVDRRELKKMLQDAQDAVDMPALNGYSAKIQPIEVHSGKIYVTVNYYDSNGSPVGHSSIDWSKRGGQLVAHHGFMSLDTSTQGKGLSEISNSVFENLYRYNGVSEVNTQANITIGTYAWAVLGFGWDPNNFDYRTVEQMRSRIDEKGRGLDISEAERQRMAEWKTNLERMRSELGPVRTPTRDDFERYDIPSPNDLAMWGRSNSTGAKPGKDGLIFSNIAWYASADLPNIPFTDDLVEDAAPNGLTEGGVTTGETGPDAPDAAAPGEDVPTGPAV